MKIGWIGVLLCAAAVAVACDRAVEVAQPAPTSAPASTNEPQGDQPAPTETVEETDLPKVIGSPVFIETSGGVFSVTANAVTDPSPSTNQFNVPEGRWVVVDWTIRNEGDTVIDLLAFTSLKLQTVDGFVVDAGNHAGHPSPGMDYFPTLGPGQETRGYLAYDVPGDSALRSAIFNTAGSPQIVIVDFGD